MAGPDRPSAVAEMAAATPPTVNAVRTIVRRSGSEVEYGRLRATANGRPSAPTAESTPAAVKPKANALQSPGEMLRTSSTRERKLNRTNRNVVTIR